MKNWPTEVKVATILWLFCSPLLYIYFDYNFEYAKLQDFRGLPAMWPWFAFFALTIFAFIELSSFFSRRVGFWNVLKQAFRDAYGKDP